MAQGVPAVLTAVGGMPELVNHGTAGLLVEPSNPAMLAEAIRTLYADPQLRRTMGEKARDLIRSTFHVSTTVERMFKEFSRLATIP
jgi:glycosyltransferase involved in cell wall biosynthesis